MWFILFMLLKDGFVPINAISHRDKVPEAPDMGRNKSTMNQAVPEWTEHKARQ
jgi:hypothetical protein